MTEKEKILSRKLYKTSDEELVRKDIPPGVIAAGIPCRVIREITEQDSMENIILE